MVGKLLRHKRLISLVHFYHRYISLIIICICATLTAFELLLFLFWWRQPWVLITATSTSPVTPTAQRPLLGLLGEDGDHSELSAGPEPTRYQSGPEAVWNVVHNTKVGQTTATYLPSDSPGYFFIELLIQRAPQYTTKTMYRLFF